MASIVRSIWGKGAHEVDRHTLLSLASPDLNIGGRRKARERFADRLIPCRVAHFPERAFSEAFVSHNGAAQPSTTAVAIPEQSGELKGAAC
jgi:hypothetical protein